MAQKSFFEMFNLKENLIDRKNLTNEDPVDVIIPIINTNFFFEKNLYSFYREIPINRLIIGDAGITDDSIEIVKNFPRVVIINQSKYISQGYCIAELISHVETEWFIYLHADVYLPENWYVTMKKYQKEYDWFECDRRYVALIEYLMPHMMESERAHSGSQMGRKKAFEKIIPIIEDDFLQRNEDIIFAELIKSFGYKYGRVLDTFHYHQIMDKKGNREPKFKISLEKRSDREFDIKINYMQAKGIIKHLYPKPYLIKNVNYSLKALYGYYNINLDGFRKWVKKENKIWLKFIKIDYSFHQKMLKFLLKLARRVYKKIFDI